MESKELGNWATSTHKKNEKPSFKLGENIVEFVKIYGSVFGICKEFLQLIRDKQPNRKMGKRHSLYSQKNEYK